MPIEHVAPVESPLASAPRTLVGYPVLMLLRKVIAIANEQKAITQQKSHMALSLSKQLKAIGHMLDRQAEESHLLPTHSLRTSATNLHTHQLAPLEDNMFDTNRAVLKRIETWAAASEYSGKALTTTISNHLENGGMDLLEAQEHLLGLLELLGTDIESENEADNGPRPDGASIWSSLDGKLGVI